MANVNTDLVTNFVAVPQVLNPAQQLHGVKRIAQGTIALAAGDLSANDTVMLAPIPSNASISSIKLYNDDLDSGTTNTADVGLYKQDLSVVDADAYASAIWLLLVVLAFSFAVASFPHQKPFIALNAVPYSVPLTICASNASASFTSAAVVPVSKYGCALNLSPTTIPPNTVSLR